MSTEPNGPSRLNGAPPRATSPARYVPPMRERPRRAPVPAQQDASRGVRSGEGARRPPWWSWLHTLRWRLALSYIVIVVGLLVVLGVVLNVVVTNIVFRGALTYFADDTLAVINTGAPAFNRDIRGTAPDCANALATQDAFQGAIAQPLLASNIGIQQVFLLDPQGSVVASDGTSVGAPTAPDFSSSQASAILGKLPKNLGALPTGKVIAHASYLSAQRRGPEIGVSLLVVRYPTVTACERPFTAATGIIEVTTTFPHAQATVVTVRLLLFLSVAVAALLALVLGPPLIARALSPLTRMNLTARRIAAGDLSQRVALPHSDDEVGRLAESFDEMIARIEVAFAAQQASEQRMRQFIADASHELRTPLTSIRGYTDVLLRGAKDDPQTVELVLLATQREAERMTRLVNDLLMLARLDAGRPLDRMPLDLIGLVGEAVDQARLLAGEREVSWRTDGLGRLDVLGDADRLKQVLLILLDNALKYGPQMTDGWVRVAVGRDEARRIAGVRVSDNGPGIAPDDLPHIFDRFYRAERAARHRRITGDSAGTYHSAQTGTSAIGPSALDPSHSSDPPSAARAGRAQSGSGLGLAIARAIAQAHGGSLTAESVLGQGTTFTLTLPLP